MKLTDKEVLEELLIHCKGLEKQLRIYNRRDLFKTVVSITYSVGVGTLLFLSRNGTLDKWSKQLNEKIKELNEKESSEEDSTVEEQPTDQ